MKQILSLFLLALLSLGSLAAPAPADTLTLSQLQETLREHPLMAGGTKYNYPVHPYAVAPAPKGYEPVYISHYGRHGARYATKAAKYDVVADVLTHAHDEGRLTEKGEALYQDYMAIYPALKGHEGDLTRKGQSQHRFISRRMQEAYPGLFKGGHVDARSSVVPRAVISMASFCDEIRKHYPKIQLDVSSNSTDLPFTCLVTGDYPQQEDLYALLKNPEFARNYGAALKKQEPVVNTFIRRYFTEGGAPEKPAEFFSTLGEVVFNLQCVDFESDFSQVFTEEEQFALWEGGNYIGVIMFVPNPYTHGVIGAYAWPLLQDILDKADADLARQDVTVRLRFGHDTVVGPIMSLLGIDGWGDVGADLDLWKYRFQYWNIPMASNLQFVFYRNKKKPEDVLVRLMYNETDQILPIEDQSQAPYYRWSDFKAHYAKVVEEARTTLNLASGNPVLDITGGKVQGVKEGEVLVYKGIPFAAPPVGDLRGKAPSPVLPWKGTRKADHFAPAALQDPISPDDPIYYREFYKGEELQYSEDCLSLNVWAPASAVGRPDAKAPVAVWIHGGAFSHGYSYEKEFDGAEWAKRGVILVTLAYRLGDLGFGPASQTGPGPESQLGFQDQMAALRWVRQNIGAFGGDPFNVTLMGQSAGAISVKYLLTFPEAQPLFAKAILQSGGGVNEMSGGLPEGTRGENHYFGRHMDSGSFDNKPIFMGWVAQDPAFLGKDSILEFAARHAARTDAAPLYVYDFERNLPGEGPGEPDWGAFHSFELWYSFGTLGRSWRPFTEADYDLSRRMLDAWTGFAKTASPGWAPYTETNPHVEILDIE